MLFTSPSFLFVFLPLALLFYSITPNHLKKYTLFACNIIFYLFLIDFDPVIFLVFFMLIMYTYLAGREIRASGKRSVFVFFVLLEVFGFFGYRILINILGMRNSPIIGVAFFFLASVSYMFDVYRKDMPNLPSFFDTSLYLSFFPVLIAGPVIKYKDFLVILEKRHFKVETISRGVILFCIGFIKKTIVVATIAKSLDTFSDLFVPEMTVGALFFVCVFYFICVIFDFWGYSDMARGIALMFGFGIPENIKNCLGASSVLDFFGKFYTCLGSWIKDYVYRALLPTQGKIGRTTKLFLTLFCSVSVAVWFKTDFIMLTVGLVMGLVVYMEGNLNRIKKLRSNPIISILLRMLNIFVLSFIFYICSYSDFTTLISNIGSVDLSVITTHIYLIYPAVLNMKFLFVLLIVFAILFVTVFEHNLGAGFSERTRSIYRMIYNIFVIVVFAFSVIYFLPQNPEYFAVPFNFTVF